jgi:hypothetical protein
MSRKWIIAAQRERKRWPGISYANRNTQDGCEITDFAAD